MKVEVSLYASLASRLPAGCKGTTCTLVVAEGTTVGGLLDHLAIAPDEPKIVFLNGVHARREDPLKEGDRVGVFPPIAGG